MCVSVCVCLCVCLCVCVCVVNKVDIEGNKQTVLEEGKWVLALQESEKRKRREELRKQLIETHGDEVNTLMITATKPIIHGVPQPENEE